MKKTGRNDPCVCGSGKKFKKCCERKMISKKFMAKKIETRSTIVSFFQKKITQINTKDKISEENVKSIKANIKNEKNANKENVFINNSVNQESINNS